MIPTTQMDRQRTSARPGWLLAGAGVLSATAGIIWWAWDAGPAQGKAFLLAGLVIAGTGVVLARRRTTLPGGWVAVAAVVLALFAGYGIWAAVATVISQGAARTL